MQKLCTTLKNENTTTVDQEISGMYILNNSVISQKAIIVINDTAGKIETKKSKLCWNSTPK